MGLRMNEGITQQVKMDRFLTQHSSGHISNQLCFAFYKIHYLYNMLIFNGSLKC